MKRAVIAVFLLFAFLFPCSACAEKAPRPILYTAYRQMGWGDRIEIACVDSNGDLWALNGYDSTLHWPYQPEEQLQFLTEHKFEQVGRLDHDDLFDLESLVSAVEASDLPSYSAACDAGTERSYAVRYTKEGRAEAILLGMSGDDCFENPDPNAQGLYLAVHRLFPEVTCYAGLMGPVGFTPVGIADFCSLGNLAGAAVLAYDMDCEAGPTEIPLSAKDQALILDAVQNGTVTGKVSAVVTTGGYTDYCFYRDDQYLGTVSFYEGLLCCPDGMYSVEWS